MGQLDNFAASLPPFTNDPADRLRHTVAAFAGTPDHEWAILATQNAIPGHDQTGLTWGDLRELAARLA